MTAGRSPAYPYVDLGKAVELSKKIHSFAKGHPASIESIFKYLGFKGITGSSKKTLAALKYFGLVDQAHGSKDAKLSKRALEIIHGIEGSADHKKALKDAFLDPTIYSYCWETWGMDDISDEVMKSHLILKKGFNDSTVQGFINDYKSSRGFAGMAQADSMGGEIDPPVIPKVGDFVQWESRGVLQFKEAKRVTQVFETEGYIHVEGSNTGIPLDEVEVVEPPIQDPLLDNQANKTRVGGIQKGAIAPPGVGMRQETFALDNGDITIQWPSEISAESFEDFSDWLDILKRKIKRSVKGPSSDGQEAEE